MPRQRLGPGEHGKITVTPMGGGVFEARTYVRDSDGGRRKVRRTGRSEEDARRELQRHLKSRTTPLTDQVVTDRTTLAELFEVWIAAKVAEGDIAPQTEAGYRTVWRVHAESRIGRLRVREFPTSRADAHLKAMASVRQAHLLRIVLRGMLSMAVRFDIVPTNPVTEARPRRATKRDIRAVTAQEYRRVLAAVTDFTGQPVRGPARAPHLLAFIELATATGARPGEVLAVRWCDVDLLGDPPTVTICGTVIDHGIIPGVPAHRQGHRKHGAPPLTVVLPRRAVDVLADLFGKTGPEGLVLRNRDGGPLSANNLRRALRLALPEDLRWITPHSFRRTAGTVVRDSLGVEAAQAQLGHAHLATTEGHYVEKRTTGPDARTALEEFMGGGESSR